MRFARLRCWLARKLVQGLARNPRTCLGCREDRWHLRVSLERLLLDAGIHNR